MKPTALGFRLLICFALALLSATGCSGGSASEDVGASEQALCGSVTASITPVVPGTQGQLGQSFTLQATPGGCVSGTPEVRIDHLRPGASNFVTDRNWSSSASWVWNTATASAGGPEVGGWHIFQILVREPGATNYQAYTTIDYYLHPSACTGGGTTTASRAPASVGQSITLTSTAPGCNTPEFKITHLRPGSSTFQTDSGFSTANASWVWNTATANAGGPEPAGYHVFQILIRAQGSGAVYESYITFDYNLGGPTCTGLTSTPSARSGTVGQTIDITNVAAGCGSPEFRIDHLRPGASNFQTDAIYSGTNATYHWNTATANNGNPEKPGYHIFQILVRAQGSTSVYQAYATFDVNLRLPVCSQVTTTASPVGSATAGAQVTISNSATGCTIPEYRIDHLRPGAANFVTDSAYSPLNSSWQWDTSTETPGFHVFQILVRQQGSTGIYESYTTLGYTLRAAAACSTAGISFNPVSPGTIGTAVTITGAATGCAFPTYRYEYQAPGSSSWTVLQDWTSSNAALWNTNAAASGTYTFRVLVRAAGSAASSEATASNTYLLNPSSTPTGGAAISAGAFHTCELTSTGKVACWGYNAQGQLGSSSAPYGASLTPLTVSGITAVSVGAGYSHTCAVLTSGAVNCWGQNQVGQLGNGSFTDSQSPVAVSGISNAVSLSVGASHTCAVLSNGQVKCWGYNSQGQLGDGTGTNRNSPVLVPGITTARQVAAGYYHTCALLADATVRCWGANSNGELGNTSNVKSLTPVTVSSLSGVTSISAGYDSTCALKSDHTIACWGANSEGELGDNSTTARNAPVAVSGITTAVSVSEGTFHGCAALQDGTAQCWGRGGYGELGDGLSTSSLVPVTVSNLTTVVSVASGLYHSCALLADGSARCWGHGSEGELGNGSQNNSAVPAVVAVIP